MAVKGIFSAVLLALALTVGGASSYKLSQEDGSADIGAYHVQPGRCANVERRLGRTRYDYFFRENPYRMTFLSDTISSSAVPPPSTNGGAGSVVPAPGKTGGAGSVVPPSGKTGGAGTPSSSAGTSGDDTAFEEMDATSLCAYNPDLTEGYSGNYEDQKPYLVYSRCLYGTNDMKALCGTTDAEGRPTRIINPVQATCPQGTKCKNLCATMTDRLLTSPYAAQQVQLAQCFPMPMWQKLTDMYRPRPATQAPTVPADPAHEPKAGAAGGPTPKTGAPSRTGTGAPGARAGNLAPVAADPFSGSGSKYSSDDPKVVDKTPAQDPSKEPTHVSADGTIPGKVLPAPPSSKPATPDGQSSTARPSGQAGVHIQRPEDSDERFIPLSTDDGEGTGSAYIHSKLVDPDSTTEVGGTSPNSEGALDSVHKPSPFGVSLSSIPSTDTDHGDSGLQAETANGGQRPHQNPLSLMGFRKRAIHRPSHPGHAR